MTLDVAIATWQPSGIERIADMNLPHVPGVRYIVSWQLPGPNPVIPPSVAEREDIDVVIFNIPGVSANRNNALTHSSADIILMADDDLHYTAEDLLSVIDAFVARPYMDLATFRYRGSNKRYPVTETRIGLPLPRFYSVATVEIAFRRKLLDELKFDELYGPGAPVWQGAEDEKFLYDAVIAGFTCVFIPLDITTHYGTSTGSRPITSAGVAAASGRIIRLLFPRSWLPRILLKSWRQWRNGASFLFCLYHQLRGAFSDGTDA